MAISPENTRVSTAGALEASHIIKASAGNLRLLHIARVGGAGTVFAQVFDSATLPADTAVPIWRSSALAADTQLTLNFGTSEGLYCADGIVVCISTTAAVKTIGGAEALFGALID